MGFESYRGVLQAKDSRMTIYNSVVTYVRRRKCVKKPCVLGKGHYNVAET